MRRQFRYLLPLSLLCLYQLLVVLPAVAEELQVRGRITRYHAPLVFQELLVPLNLSAGEAGGCFASGDVDGDERDELFIVDAERHAVVLISVQERGRASKSEWSTLSGDTHFARCVAGDFSGDGLADLALMVSGGQRWLFITTQRAAAPTQRWVTFDIPSVEVTAAFAAIRPNAPERDGIFLSSQGEVSSRWVVAKSGELLWFHRAPEHRGEAAGEFSGGGGSDVLMRHLSAPAVWRLLYRTPTGALANSFAWMGFETRDQWELRGKGDFNGDTLDDLLLESDKSKGWWVGLSDATQPLLQPVRGVSRGRLPVTTGDFDGDGLADLVSPKQEERSSLWFAFAEAGPPVSAVTVRASGGGEAISDGDGRFTIAVTADETVTPQKAGYVFSRTKLGMRYGFGRVRRRANFVATDITGADGVIGRAIVLGEESGPGPFACVGFNPEWARNWGEMGDRCHQGYAYFSFRDLGREDTTPRLIRSGGACCRLPADDVLTGEVVESFDSCPDGFVGIGGRIPKGDENYLICGKINASRYQLGPVHGGRYFGVGYSMWKERGRVEGSQLPVALRYALGRENFTNWTGEQCVGNPPGALVTGKRPGSCAGIEFRELQYVGLPGDPVRGTPVKMLPDCAKIENEFDPLSGCRP